MIVEIAITCFKADEKRKPLRTLLLPRSSVRDVFGTDLTNSYAKDVFKKCSSSLAFRFYGSNGKVIGTSSNLPELISTLPDIPATITQFHIFRETTQDIFEPRQLDGPVVRSDLALWINYVLGDVELSRRIYEIGKEEKNAEKLKTRVIEILKERERELINIIRSA